MKGKLELERLENRLLLNGDGWLNLANNFLGNTVFGSVVNYDSLEVSDEFDNSWDTLWNSPMPGEPSIFSNITTHKLKEDYRNPVSTTPFDLGLVYNGTTSISTENQLDVSIPYGSGWEFGSKPITLEEDNGQRNDIRRAIANEDGGAGIGVIPLEDVPAGTYTSSNPYATPEVHFKQTADLNNSGTVDLVDLMLLKQNYLNSETDYVNPQDMPENYLLGDITGSDGLPDGQVNLKDYAEFANQYGSE